MASSFRFLMLGAMYENGGNTTHRFLDGHPQMYVYPFESQLGTRLVTDQLASLFPVKYRWPVFALDATPLQDYRSIIDEELKVRVITPHVSKFRDAAFDLSDEDRCARYEEHVNRTGRSRANNITAFFRSTFEAWKNHNASGKESVYVGYSPIVAVDAQTILTELPDAHFLHVVRNPWSAYADTKKRPVPLSLKDYLFGWTVNQYSALIARSLFPDRMHILRIEDVMKNSLDALGGVCKKMGLDAADSLSTPTWNGTALGEIYPWGTIRTPTEDANLATARELSKEEIEEIRLRAWEYLNVFNYADFV